jgi:integrase
MDVKQRKRSPYDPYKITIGGKVRWQVNLPGTYRTRQDGKQVRVRPRKTFSSAQEAHTFARLKRIERDNYGVSAVSMDEKLRGDTLAAQQLLTPYGITVLEAAEYYVRHRQRLENSATVSDAVSALLEAKAADNLRPRYLKDLQLRLNRFSGEFSDRLLADIQPAEIELWLRSLGLAALGRNTYRLRLHLLFEHARKCGWVESNPLADVTKAKVRETVPGILTVEQSARLLELASPATLPYWVFSLFAGLRSAEVGRLEWKDVHFEENLIEVPSLKAKTAARRFVRLRENALQWLAPYRQRHGKVCPPNLRKLLETDRQAAGILKWDANACRHSFASYALAHYRDAKDLALELGHSRSDTLFRFYHQRVKPELARRFWRIVPALEGERILKVVA